jgi:Signal transduction histidine kinase
MVVDDTLADLKLMAGLLFKYGYQVRPVSSGTRALESVAIEKPDLIMLDVMMPGMDGYEVCRRLKLDEHSRDIPVIFISALNEAANKVIGFKAGGVDYITKPFQEEEVLIRMETHLALSRLQQQVLERNVQLEQEIVRRRRAEEELLQEHEELECRVAERTKEIEESNRQLRGCEKNAQNLIAQLRQSDQNKNVFLNMLSHELRNPLALIMMSLSLQDQVPPGGEEDLKARKVMARQTAHLSRLVEDLLDVTRITQNKITLKKERVELNELVKIAVADYRASFTEKEMELRIESTSDLLYLEADSARLTQIIGNLLHNAFKFTSQGGQVLISVYHDESTLEAIIKIQDNGIGIKPEILPDLFEPFMQVDSTLDRSSGGLGLGLAIVKGMVELHKGSVSVHSEGLGKGTQLTVRLPLANVEARKKEQESRNGGFSAGSFRILIIDDIPDIAEILSSLLGYLGHEVATACSGSEGIAKAKQFHPEVVICDIGLPGMNGYEVAKSLRNDKELKDTFLIALSGYAQPEDLERARKAGFNRHLAKPVDIAILEQILADVS